MSGPHSPLAEPDGRPLPRTRVGWAVAALTCVAACGGGGEGLPVVGGPPPPSGINGTIFAPDIYLGRMVAQEPNDDGATAYLLPPVAARTRLEVAGNLGVSAALYGRIDVTDVLRLRPLAPSQVTLTVTFPNVDAVGGGSTSMALEFLDSQGASLGKTTGASPLVLSVTLAASQSALVALVALEGHFPYVATFTLSDAPAPQAPGARGSPPSLLATPAPRAPLASRPFAPTGATSASATCAEGYLLVRLKPGVDAQAFAATRGLALHSRCGSGTWRMGLPAEASAASSSAASKARRSAARLTDDPEVAFAEPDWVVQPLGGGDPYLARQWNLRAIGAPQAWEVTRGVPEVVIGVVDTGSVAHPDLEGQTVAGYDFITDPARSLDGDGRDSDPTDLGDGLLRSGFSSWHGTHVSVIAAGRGDDGHGCVGVAPGCRLMSLRALGVGGGLSSDVADAILYAAGVLTTGDGLKLAAPLRILNLSLGSVERSAEIESACSVAAGQGVLLVAATGNDAANVLYPAALPTVMAVGAVDGMLDGASYSNHGPQVSMVAPGGLRLLDRHGDGWPDAVLSAAIDETLHPREFGHAWYVGTSQAAPHVAAAAALLLSVAPELTRSQLRQRLEQSALDRGLGGFDELHGHGLLQVHTALKRLLEDRGTPLVAPALHLPVDALRFVGFEAARVVPVVNAGGGTLDVIGAQAVTDDGAPWLGATLIPGFPGADSNVARLEVLVDRNTLPQQPAWSSGTLRLYGPTGSLGLLRVTAAAGAWSRVGSPFRVVTLDATTGGVLGDGYAHPEQDYRYWHTALPPGTYRVKSGDDLDANGFFCEPADLCGWYGGPTENQAALLPLPDSTPQQGAHVFLR